MNETSFYISKTSNINKSYEKKYLYTQPNTSSYYDTIPNTILYLFKNKINYM